MKKETRYYCPFCKKVFTYWCLGHDGQVSVCAGGCNTTKQQMWELRKKRLNK